MAHVTDPVGLGEVLAFAAGGSPSRRIGVGDRYGGLAPSDALPETFGLSVGRVADRIRRSAVVSS